MSSKQIQLEAKLFKGFADKSRLLILETLSAGRKSVTEITEETGLSQPNTSAHLTCLLECGLIRKEKKGREVFYEVSTNEVSKIMESIRKILKKYSKEIYDCTRY
ncbi:MAG: winged helix-turn-helix transcriptional regulator [Candidatus Buchananbacteria bacterium]|nr:winged helix-turn-helix transcriptional regulator [Candidatus Buchananbacteria bacterium]